MTMNDIRAFQQIEQVERKRLRRIPGNQVGLSDDFDRQVADLPRGARVAEGNQACACAPAIVRANSRAYRSAPPEPGVGSKMRAHMNHTFIIYTSWRRPRRGYAQAGSSFRLSRCNLDT